MGYTDVGTFLMLPKVNWVLLAAMHIAFFLSSGFLRRGSLIFGSFQKLDVDVGLTCKRTGEEAANAFSRCRFISVPTRFAPWSQGPKSLSTSRRNST